MTQNNSSGGTSACSIVCWLLALAFGIFVAAALIGWTGMHGLLAAVIGLVAMLIAGWLLKGMFCTEEVSSGSITTTTAATTAAAAVGAGAVATSASAKQADKPASEKAAASKAAPKAKPAAAKKPAAKKPAASKTAAKSTATSKTKSAAASKPAAKKPAAKKTTAKSTAASKTKSAAASKPAAVKKPAAAAKKPAAKKPAAAKFYRKPPAKVDDLKLISGVGPKLEKTLNEIGVYQFAQVAVWKKAEIKKVDDQLKFKGRIERDNWMKQAKILAKGGDTEFSKKKRKK